MSRRRLPRASAPAACFAALAVLGAARDARAQEAPAHRPFFGLGLLAGASWPDALALRAAGRSEGFPLAPTVGVGLRARLGNRFMIVGTVAGYYWQNTSNQVEFESQGGGDDEKDTFLVVPIDLGFRVNVVPVPGPVAVHLGVGGRATVVTWATEHSGPLIDRGVGFTLGVWPEVAVETLVHRRFSFEVFSRYTFGLLPGATGGAGQRFDNAGALGGLMLGVAVHTYL